MAIQYPTINGKWFAFQSVEMDVNGTILRGYKDISFETSGEFGNVYGTHPQRLGQTRGQIECTASLTMYLPEWNQLLAALGNGYMETVFPISIVFSETEGPVDVHRVKLVGCRIKSVSHSVSQGADAAEVAIELDVFEIIEEGYTPFVEMLSA